MKHEAQGKKMSLWHNRCSRDMRIRSYRIALELFPSFSLLTRTRDLLVLLLVEQRPDLRASPGHVLRDDVLTSVPAQLVLAAMGRRGCDGATRVNELLWRRDTTPNVDDNRPQCGDIDRASWSLIGTARRRHVATSDNAVSSRTPQS